MIGATVVINFNHLGQLEGKAKSEAGKRVQKLGFDGEAFMKQLFAGPKSGAMYGGHQASAPGEPPAIESAALMNSVGAKPAGPMTSVITVGAEHGPLLELGTRTIAPRPFVLPTVDYVKTVAATAFLDLL